MSDVDCGHWAEAEATPAQLPTHTAELTVHVPVEINPDTGVVNVIYPPVSAAVVVWDRLTPSERTEHRAVCNGCKELCGEGRAYGWCKTEGMETEVMDDGNCTCGSPVLMGTDYSDVKWSER